MPTSAWRRRYAIRGGVGILIDRTTGTNIGDMHGHAGLTAAFNGVNNEVFGSSATKTVATSSYVGKTLVAPKIFKKAIVCPSFSGFVTGTDPQITLTIRGKTGAAPSSESDGTIIGTLEPFTDVNFPNREIASMNLVDSWNHIWVQITHDGPPGVSTMTLSELILYELG